MGVFQGDKRRMSHKRESLGDPTGTVVLGMAKNVLPLALTLMLWSPASYAFSYDDIVLITQCEQRAFGHENTSDALADRLRALEAKVFGAARGGSDRQRVNAVCVALGLKAAEQPVMESLPQAQKNQPAQQAMEAFKQAQGLKAQEKAEKARQEKEKKKKQKEEEAAAKAKKDADAQAAKDAAAQAAADKAAADQAAADKAAADKAAADKAAADKAAADKAAADHTKTPESTEPGTPTGQTHTPKTTSDSAKPPGGEFPLVPVLLFGGLAVLFAGGAGTAAFIILKAKGNQKIDFPEDGSNGSAQSHESQFPHRRRRTAGGGHVHSDELDDRNEAASAPPQQHHQPQKNYNNMTGEVPSMFIKPADVPQLGMKYLPMFLTAGDVVGMQLIQDGRSTGVDNQDQFFARHGGEHFGQSLWAADEKGVIARVKDVRWVFGYDQAASMYYADTVKAHSEGLPWLNQAPPICSECHAFGGYQKTSAGVDLKVFCYLFRQGKVVAKVMVTQGTQAAQQLTVDEAAWLAQRALARVTDYSGYTNQPAPTPTPTPPAPAPTLDNQAYPPMPSGTDNGQFSNLANQWTQFQTPEGARDSRRDGQSNSFGTQFEAPSNNDRDSRRDGQATNWSPPSTEFQSPTGRDSRRDGQGHSASGDAPVRDSRRDGQQGSSDPPRRIPYVEPAAPTPAPVTPAPSPTPPPVQHRAASEMNEDLMQTGPIPPSMIYQLNQNLQNAAEQGGAFKNPQETGQLPPADPKKGISSKFGPIVPQPGKPNTPPAQDDDDFFADIDDSGTAPLSQRSIGRPAARRTEDISVMRIEIEKEELMKSIADEAAKQEASPAFVGSQAGPAMPNPAPQNLAEPPSQIQGPPTQGPPPRPVQIPQPGKPAIKPPASAFLTQAPKPKTPPAGPLAGGGHTVRPIGKPRPTSDELRSMFSSDRIWVPEHESDTDPLNAQTPTVAAGVPPSYMIILLDQSAAMSRQAGKVYLAETAAMVINRFIHGFVRRWKKHSGSPPMWYVSVIGYGEGIGPALIGNHQGQESVSVSDLATTSPLENRPGVEGRSTIIGIPVWLKPKAGGLARFCAALMMAETQVKKFLTRFPTANAPVIVNISAGTISDGDPRSLVHSIRALRGADGPVRLFNCQIVPEDADVVSLPSAGTVLNDPLARMLFEISSPLPIAEDLVGFIRHHEMGHIGRLLEMVTALDD